MNSENKILIKIGGSLMDSESDLGGILECIADIASEEKVSIILVHGGGKEISRNLAYLGDSPGTVEGLRITPPPAMDMVEMTLSGLVNKKIVRQLNRYCRESGSSNLKAVGISGVDADIFVCEQQNSELGRVGRITRVDPTWINNILTHKGLPVVSPVSVSEDSLSYNVNADTAAGALASQMKVSKLLFISDIEGVYDKDHNILSQANEEKLLDLMGASVITGGMIPKVKSCLDCLKTGVGEVHILGWPGADRFKQQVTGELNTGTILTL